MHAQASSTALNATRGVALASDLEVATSLPARTRGLLGRRALPGSGLLLDPCPSVHTWFMSTPIDVIFLDRENHVVGLMRNMKPFRMAGAWRGARTLELPVGTIAATGTLLGDLVAFRTETRSTTYTRPTDGVFIAVEPAAGRATSRATGQATGQATG